MTEAQAVQFLCVQASVRYEHMTRPEQRTFLEAVMTVAATPAAELAARTLHAMDEAEARQGELFACFKNGRNAE